MRRFDHIDGDGFNNRFANLRYATRSQKSRQPAPPSAGEVCEVARGQAELVLWIVLAGMVALPTPGARVPCAVRPIIRTMATSSTTGQPNDDQVFEPGLVQKKPRPGERAPCIACIAASMQVVSILARERADKSNRPSLPRCSAISVQPRS
jgi:hypothetical protein